MSRRYDSRTTIFSPEGRLYQVEYAMEAISHAGTALGILSKEGIVLAAEKKTTSKLLESISREKIYSIDTGICCAVAGITSDANNLIDYARMQAQKYLFKYNESIPVEQLVQDLCNLKQGYTQYGGLRPFGVSFLYAGYDKIYGFQLYHSDPSGNYAGWKATCIGSNSSNASTILKQDLEKGKELTLEEAKSLAIKVLNKTMEATSLASDKLEFATISLVDGVPHYHPYSDAEIDALLKVEKDKTSNSMAVDKLRSVFSNAPARYIRQGLCIQQGFFRGYVSQPAASPFRISSNSKKFNRNVDRTAKKKKGIRDILGDDLKSPAAPLSAPSLMTHKAIGFCTADSYDLHLLLSLSKDKYILMPELVDSSVHLQWLDSQDREIPAEVFVFSDGTFVTWGTSDEQDNEILQLIKKIEIGPYENSQTEQFDYYQDLTQDGGISSDSIIVGSDLPTEQAKLSFSSGLARSVKLSVLEGLLDKHILKNRHIPQILLSGKKLPLGQEAVLRNLGELFSLRAQANLHHEMLDAPDFCWSNGKMEDHFDAISKNLDVKPRIAIFNKKLDYANQIAEVLRSHLHDQHSLKLEWFIIILIGVEIAFEVLHYLERLDIISIPEKK